MHDLYQDVANKIIAALEAGTPPWIRPWSGDLDRFPANAASRRPYRGINSVLLTLEAQLRGFTRNQWLTYCQAAELGAQVRSGERGTTVVFFKVKELGGETLEAPASTRVVPLLRSFTVFNVAQIDRLPARLSEPSTETGWTRLHEPEELIAHTGATIEHGGFAAFYNLTEDRIQLPERGLFAEPSAYYGTALHELVHWTGHPSRLDRSLGRRFGPAAYGMEELVAEIGAAFLCATCRIEARLQHASYVAGWIEVLSNDKRAVFTAAAKAQQAADFVEALASPKPVPALAAEAA